MEANSLRKEEVIISDLMQIFKELIWRLNIATIIWS